ncbi:MAG: hypothetical protein A4S16_03440 [Proteobacteria bacterium SG_bin6]|nr:MAG: hypothetical protein A4S16_03440 [Proteobacteria bacterium SG_bin6]
MRLPTAAPRKVKQNYNRAARAEREKVDRLPVRFMYPSQREAVRKVEILSGVEPSAAIELLVAICAALDAEARARVRAHLIPGVLNKRKTAEQAMVIVDTCRPTFGEQIDLDFALRLLNERAGKGTNNG